MAVRRNTLLINPSRKRRTTKRRSTAASRRRTSTRRRTIRRRNTAARRRNPARRRAPARRRNPARRTIRRRNPASRRTVRRRNPSRRRSVRRRRNPTTGMASTLRRIPLVGGLLASMAGFLPFAAFGAIGVEPTVWVNRLIAPMVPQIPASLLYAVTGTLVAAVVGQFAPVAPATRQKLAIAIASAAGGVAYYKWRSGLDSSAIEEVGALEIHGNPLGRLEYKAGFGDAYDVVPLSSVGYGALVHGA